MEYNFRGTTFTLRSKIIVNESTGQSFTTRSQYFQDMVLFPTGDIFVISDMYEYLLTFDLQEVICHNNWFEEKCYLRGWCYKRTSTKILEVSCSTGFPGVSVIGDQLIGQEILRETMDVLCHLVPPEIADMIIRENIRTGDHVAIKF